MNLQIGRTLRAFAFIIILFTSVSRLCGYALEGPTWPAGSEIAMSLQLGPTNVQLQDGSGTWDNSAADALSLWNQQLDTVHFSWSADAGTGVKGDGVNSVFFSSTVYGQSFGTYVLAVTLYHYDESNQMLEADTVFNSAKKFNSYRGIQRNDPTTGQPLFDFHRVALHEFGHTLGLAHPDEHGQNVVALMNSIISNLDHLADDDIAGARSLYGFRITSNLFPPSVKLGDAFSYQITANNNPLSFGAIGLPSGIQLDSGTGAISGVPTSAGTFNVTLTAHGASKDVSATLQIVVIGPTITSTLSPFPVDVGASFSYRITASQSASSYSAAGLPAGLSLDSSTGLITGNPTAVGTFNMTVTAHTAAGDATATVRIVVLAPRITSSTAPPSVDIGGNFSYQITATGGATSFSATGLPPGMAIDAATGLISGVPTLSGTYAVTIIAHTPFGDASSIANFVVQALGTPEIPVATFPFYPSYPAVMIADPQRPRVYIWMSGALTVIDTTSLTVTNKVTIAHSVSDFSLSADGNKLWIAYGSYDSSHMLGSVDLETLTVLPELVLSVQPQLVREGLNGRLYIADPTGSIFQVDGASGGSQGPFLTAQYGSFIEISPDRRTLYVGDYGIGPNGSGSYLSRFDVSTSTPTLLQRTNQLGLGGRALTISRSGQLLFFETTGGTSEVAASNLTKVYGSIPSAGSGPPSPLALSPDDAQGFQINAYSSKIGVYSTANCQMLRAIDIGLVAYDLNLLVDGTNSYLFFSGHRPYGPSQLEVYRLGAPPLPSTPKTLLNVSTRLRTQAGDNALIGGFIISGQEAKKVALRAIAPSLPVSGKLADPVLELHDGTGALIGQNDNWNAHRADVLATGIPPSDEHESVIVATLLPGNYTVVVRGLNQSSGVALVEAYDLSSNSNSKLANISTRGKVETGDNVMIGGFIIGGDQQTNIVVRAIGPSLTQSNVAGALADPMLEVHDGNGALLAQDDDWRMYQEQPLIDSGLAPKDDRESAMILSLQPGNYTAIVRGKDNSTGVGLVEVYNLDSK
jgi:hypothetical protein